MTNINDMPIASVIQSRAGLCTDDLYHQFIEAVLDRRAGGPDPTDDEGVAVGERGVR